MRFLWVPAIMTFGNPDAISGDEAGCGGEGHLLYASPRSEISALSKAA
jgi:hypothetical protein